MVDSFGRAHDYLRVSLVEACNLRCTYCMPENYKAETTGAALPNTDEVLRLVGLFVERGVRKVRFTGGEPLLRRDLASVVAGTRELLSQAAPPADGAAEPVIAITTNALLLEKKLPSLVEAGLNRCNISLDTLDSARFEALARRPASHLARIRRGLSAALALAGESRGTDHTRRPLDVRINSVLMAGTNEEEVPTLAALARDHPCTVRFIEFMPFQDNSWQRSGVVSSAEVLRRLEGHFGPSSPAYGDAVSPDTLWTFPGFRGAVGSIPTITEPFCSGCSRLRLSADGRLQTCLFGSAGPDLLGMLRGGASDAEVHSAIDAALAAKHEMLGGHSSAAEAVASGGGRPMTRLGG